MNDALRREKLKVDKLVTSLKNVHKRYREEIEKKNSRLREFNMQLNECNRQLDECNKTITLLQNYNKADADFKDVVDEFKAIKASDQDKTPRRRTYSMPTANYSGTQNYRSQASRTFGGKLKKKSTKKKHSKYNKTKRRRKNKKN